MKSLIRAAISNSPAMNMLMIATLVVGTCSLAVMHREVFPDFDLEIVLIAVPYPGASPEEVEEGICQKIEEAVQSIEGIKKITSVAKEGAGSVILELEADVKNVQKVVSEVRSEVDRIPSFPELAEDPEVQQLTFRNPAINVAVMAPARPDASQQEYDELELRAVAEAVRNDLVQLNAVSQINLLGVRNYQIDVEIDEATLRKYGLSLQQVANIIRQENLELPGGKIKGSGEEVLLRSKNKRLVGEGIAELPIVNDPSGVVLTVGDLGAVRDEFEDSPAISDINGRPGIVLEVSRTSSEDMLAMTRAVRDYVAAKKLPGGYELMHWGDRSVDVQERLDMLVKNGIMGLVLVFIVLALFLEIRLAFWVAMGIPVAMLGAGGILLLGDQTMNMLSMFAFLMALGIIVDDAIVVGENVYSHRQMGKSYTQAAIDGTIEVVPSVTASVATTIIAFCPLLFVSGVMGKFIAVMPVAVIAMLCISLFESTFILPCHLAHRDSLFFTVFGWFFWPLSFVLQWLTRVNVFTGRLLDQFIDSTYMPILKWSIRNRWLVVAGAASCWLAAIGFVQGGFVPFVIFPKLDSNFLISTVTFPDGTPTHVTDQASQRIYGALWQANDELSQDGKPVIKLVHRTVGRLSDQANGGDTTLGGHVGSLSVELVDSQHRSVTSTELTKRWRELAGAIPGAESVTFGGLAFGPGGKPIEFKILADGHNVQELEAAVELCKARLARYPGVFDVDDDSRPGKWEFRINVKEQAKSMGVRAKDLADTIRASFYGAEVMRLQRGRHEVKLMVRYPPQQRRSIADLQEIRVRTGDGQERPITELAQIDVARGYSEINRLDQLRSITVSADLDENLANASDIVTDLQATLVPELKAQFPGVRVRWEGQQEQTQESVRSLLIAALVALLVMFALLTFQFGSYIQPVIIMCTIPFGLIGALLGHVFMQIPLTLFSFFGLVALTGVVVNDSIVLIDFMNDRVRGGVPLETALLEAGKRRFRPVLLTSATTIAGLMPILAERSFQAQLLIPMATSLAFGLLLATVVVLILVPSFYRIYRQFVPWKGALAEEYDPGRAPENAPLPGRPGIEAARPAPLV